MFLGPPLAGQLFELTANLAPGVRDGNSMADAAILFYTLAVLRGCEVWLENPPGSMIFSLLRWIGACIVAKVRMFNVAAPFLDVKAGTCAVTLLSWRNMGAPTTTSHTAVPMTLHRMGPG